MRMLSQEALRQAIETIRKQFLEFAEDPMMEEMTGKEAMLAFASAMTSTSGKVWGIKQ
jgi:hypothetical protein